MNQLEMFVPSPIWFDGRTYDPEQDEIRLSKQINRVWKAMNDSSWHTLAELSQATGIPEASVSARIRDFRKPRFGGHTVLRERVKGGLWRYMLKPEPRVAYRGIGEWNHT
jgi:hypothetical protein